MFSLNNVREFRRDARDRANEIAREASLRAANEAQRKALLDTAPMRDLQDLVPVLSERVRLTKVEYDKAVQELADVLDTIEQLG
jgi:hypothetical protein